MPNILTRRYQEVQGALELEKWLASIEGKKIVTEILSINIASMRTTSGYRGQYHFSTKVIH